VPTVEGQVVNYLFQLGLPGIVIVICLAVIIFIWRVREADRKAHTEALASIAKRHETTIRECKEQHAKTISEITAKHAEDKVQQAKYYREELEKRNKPNEEHTRLYMQQQREVAAIA